MKFAWSRPAALQLAHEIGVLAALAREPAVPFLPEIVASSISPLLLITRRVPGISLFDVIDSIDPDRAARQLVRFLAALHHPATRQRAEAAVGPDGLLQAARAAVLAPRAATWLRDEEALSCQSGYSRIHGRRPVSARGMTAVPCLIQRVWRTLFRGFYPR